MQNRYVSGSERERRATAAANRAEARALVDRAAASVDLRADLSMRSTVVRLLCAMYRINGSMNLRRGWVDRTREVLAAAGLPSPSGKVLRWYRSNLAANAMMFAHCPLVDVATLEAIEARYLRP